MSNPRLNEIRQELAYWFGHYINECSTASMSEFQDTITEYELLLEMEFLKKMVNESSNS